MLDAKQDLVAGYFGLIIGIEGQEAKQLDRIYIEAAFEYFTRVIGPFNEALAAGNDAELNGYVDAFKTAMQTEGLGMVTLTPARARLSFSPATLTPFNFIKLLESELILHLEVQADIKPNFSARTYPGVNKLREDLIRPSQIVNGTKLIHDVAVANGVLCLSPDFDCKLEHLDGDNCETYEEKFLEGSKLCAGALADIELTKSLHRDNGGIGFERELKTLLESKNELKLYQQLMDYAYKVSVWRKYVRQSFHFRTSFIRRYEAISPQELADFSEARFEAFQTTEFTEIKKFTARMKFFGLNEADTEGTDIKRTKAKAAIGRLHTAISGLSIPTHFLSGTFFNPIKEALLAKLGRNDTTGFRQALEFDIQTIAEAKPEDYFLPEKRAVGLVQKEIFLEANAIRSNPSISDKIRELNLLQGRTPDRINRILAGVKEEKSSIDAFIRAFNAQYTNPAQQLATTTISDRPTLIYNVIRLANASIEQLKTSILEEKEREEKKATEERKRERKREEEDKDDLAPIPIFQFFSLFDNKNSPYYTEVKSTADSDDKKDTTASKFQVSPGFEQKLGRMKMFKDGEFIGTLTFEATLMPRAEILKLQSGGISVVSPTGYETKLKMNPDFSVVAELSPDAAKQRADLSPEESETFYMLTVISMVWWVRCHSNEKISVDFKDPEMTAAGVVFALKLTELGIRCDLDPPPERIKAKHPEAYKKAFRLVEALMRPATGGILAVTQTFGVDSKIAGVEPLAASQFLNGIRQLTQSRPELKTDSSSYGFRMERKR